MWIRQIHRWLSIALILMIAAYPFVMKLTGLPHWAVYAPLIPFGLLVITGLYLFVRPYLVKWRRAFSSRIVPQPLS